MSGPPADYSAAWAEYYQRQAQAAGGASGPPPAAGALPDYSAAWTAYYAAQAAQVAAPAAGAGAWAAPPGSYAQPAPSTSYNAVPPPTSLGTAANRPAYVIVPPRRAPAPTARSAPAPAGNAAWPPALRAYVERAFAGTPAAGRGALAASLKAVIADAQAAGDVWSRDWDALPVPAVVASGGGSGGGAWGAQHAPQPPRQPRSRWDARAPLPAPPPPPQLPPPPRPSASSTAAQLAKEEARRRAAALDAWGLPPPPSPGLPASFGAAPSKKGKAKGKGRGKRLAASPSPPLSGRGRKRGRAAPASPWGGDSADSPRDSSDPVEAARRASRAGRFGEGAADGAPPPPKKGGGPAFGGSGPAAARRAALERRLAERGDADLGEADWDALAVKGRSTALEKSYFRLTAPPDPAAVRPPAVLDAALDRLVGLLACREATYFYAADQFKGMRQDCTVQRARGRLAARVYEAAARAALEYGDAAEYNQCQAQLVALHGGGTRAATTPPVPASAPPDVVAEFLAYRILYQAAHAAASAGERVALLRTLASAAAHAAHPAVAHALAARAAIARRDAVAFFDLYRAAPRLGRALMDIAAPRLRFETLTALVRALRPALPVALAARVLGFGPAALHGGEGGDDAPPLPGCSASTFPGACVPAAAAVAAAAAATAWLTAHGAVIKGDGDGAAVDCKASAPRLAVPDDAGAVAHGDANLAIDDFLKGMAPPPGV